MAQKKVTLQPGPALHAVITGAMKAQGTSFYVWCHSIGVYPIMDVKLHTACGMERIMSKCPAEVMAIDALSGLSPEDRITFAKDVLLHIKEANLIHKLEQAANEVGRHAHIGMIISGLGLSPRRDQGRFDHPVWVWLDAIKGNDLILSGWLRPNAPALQVRSWAKPSANISNKNRSPLVGVILLSFTIYLLTAIGNAFS